MSRFVAQNIQTLLPNLARHRLKVATKLKGCQLSLAANFGKTCLDVRSRADVVTTECYERKEGVR